MIEKEMQIRVSKFLNEYMTYDDKRSGEKRLFVSVCII